VAVTDSLQWWQSQNRHITDREGTPRSHQACSACGWEVMANWYPSQQLKQQWAWPGQWAWLSGCVCEESCCDVASVQVESHDSHLQHRRQRRRDVQQTHWTSHHSALQHRNMTTITISSSTASLTHLTVTQWPLFNTSRFAARPVWIYCASPYNADRMTHNRSV